MHDIINENQSGFRGGRGTTDNIFSLAVISQLHLRLQKQTIFAIFIDFRSAFGTVKHGLLWQKLYDAGISAKYIRILQNLYSKALLQIKVKKQSHKPYFNKARCHARRNSLTPPIFSLHK